MTKPDYLGISPKLKNIIIFYQRDNIFKNIIFVQNNMS